MLLTNSLGYFFFDMDHSIFQTLKDIHLSTGEILPSTQPLVDNVKKR